MIGNEKLMAILQERHLVKVEGSGKIIVRQNSAAKSDLLKFQRRISQQFVEN
jgi:hypothetical protein